MQETEAEPGSELTDIAAAAQSIQPTGYTLETTKVGIGFVNPVPGTTPVLLKCKSEWTTWVSC